HNGIIENYYDLKKQLEKKNYVFQSDTDTEVIPHLIQEYMKETNDFKESIKKACQCLEGRYAFIAICNDFDGLIGIKKGSPLIIGHGKTNSFITSDVVAFAEHTKKVTYLDDDEMVIIK
ncbi:MAG: glutamine--fructose-6-phosphate aminotransferase, partial [Candidatus Aenigmarchaeota archaeon]|nr:glutamine--fructose-6-phosphate aminotransferase [Candidatus Aenigmarchaeota archaeon]